MRRVYVITGIALALLLLGTLLHSAPITNPMANYGEPANRLVTIQQPWVYARNIATTGYVGANDATPDPNAMTWQNTGTYLPIPAEWNHVSIGFLAYGDGNGAGDPNAGVFDCNVYIVDTYGSWDHVAEFSVAVGELEATHNPVTGAEINGGSLDLAESYKWAEGNFTSTTSYDWIATLDYTGCTNGIGRLNFDAMGARVLVILIDNISATTRIFPVVKGR